jgi:hypothetical protein
MESAEYIGIHQESSKILKERLLGVRLFARKTTNRDRGTSTNEVRYLCQDLEERVAES